MVRLAEVTATGVGPVVHPSVCGVGVTLLLFDVVLKVPIDTFALSCNTPSRLLLPAPTIPVTALFHSVESIELE